MIQSCVGFYFGYSYSTYSAKVVCCVEIIVVTSTVDIVQWYSVEWSLLWLQHQEL